MSAYLVYVALVVIADNEEDAIDDAIEIVECGKDTSELDLRHWSIEGLLEYNIEALDNWEELLYANGDDEDEEFVEDEW